MHDLVIFYDGDCGLCNNSVRFILRHEQDQRLKFASLTSSHAKLVLTRFGLNSNFDDSILFFKNDKLYSKSIALLHIIPFLKWYFYPLLIFWVIPEFIRNLCYDLVARNRKRLSSFCELPKSENSDRFLD